jgi:putative inorganic carbon (HCO3(-)) transporter
LIGSGNIAANRAVGWSIVLTLSFLIALGTALAVLPLAWAIAVVVGSIAVVGTLVRPQLGVLLIVPAVPFGSLLQANVGAVDVGVTEALVVLVLGAWAIRLATRPRARIALPRLTLPILLFLGALVVSALGAQSLQHSAKEVLKWVEVLTLFLFVSSEMDRRWTRALVVVLLCTGGLVALYGIYQFLFRVGPDAFVLFDRFMRAHGTFEQPNPYGGYLGLTLPLAVGVVVAGILPVAGRIKVVWILLAACTGGLMLLALVMSWSRGAWLGFGAAAAAMAIAVVARSGRAAAFAAVLAVLAAYVLLVLGVVRVPPAIVQRFTDFVPYVGVRDVRGAEITDGNFAVLERVAHWQAAWQMWSDRPWFGVGVGNYEPVYSHYALPLWPLALGHAHNYYLNIAAEAGVVGLATYVLLCGVAVVGAWRASRRAESWEWGVTLGVLGVLVHLGVHSLFDNLYVHAMYLQVAILLGVITPYAKSQGQFSA